MKTIIIYSTKYGSVAKAARKLTDNLRGEAVVANVKSNPAFDDYDCVVLGGSIYAGGIQKEMKSFIKEHLTALQKKRIGLFICAGATKEAVVSSYLKKVFPQELQDKAVAAANFGYEYDLKRFSFFDRLIVRLVGVKKSESVFFEDKIREFAQKIEQ